MILKRYLVFRLSHTLLKKLEHLKYTLKILILREQSSLLTAYQGTYAAICGQIDDCKKQADSVSSLTEKMKIVSQKFINRRRY